MTRTEDDDVDDAAVISGSLREPERFAVLFHRHGPHIHRYLARRLGREVAEDLLGETFLAAFHRRDRYDTSRPDARPWLYGIATHVVGQHRRDEVRRYRLRDAVPAELDEACHADRVAADVTSQALRRHLLAALGDLSTGDRDVLLLVAWEELSYEEVAAALAIPVGTVRSRLNRARRKVRETLGATEPMTTIGEVLSSGR
ncbi:DNA-directed RNA polymerase sigma-70 factor [Longispora fulva]|uniref:RNA polymerase sigma-70 factor (ECF subfamily) n=1 Tax=Longispora fulva TaxID=619741 RepID=A0A8J7KFX2_9ACTN|nr:RNA polymerase sigma factor [Longispora fulva]MBG6136710.1 RNA polymerase sigma-70 factor (ECF subfamily) [Longispora fulva]GIG59880.1 DNA-directed RNA polymerase sigma-70 factor [Longispora fulva]